MVVYLIAGMVGVPWFAEGSSGFSTASFGYVLGFIVAAFIVGRLAERGASTTALRTAGLMVVGNLAIYAVGVTWLKFAIDVDWATAMSLGVVPFLIGDAVKIALAAGLLPLAWKGLEKMQLRNN
jgi:biotin transport system substrate-specific component